MPHHGMGYGMYHQLQPVPHIPHMQPVGYGVPAPPGLVQAAMGMHQYQQGLHQYMQQQPPQLHPQQYHYAQHQPPPQPPPPQPPPPQQQQYLAWGGRYAARLAPDENAPEQEPAGDWVHVGNIPVPVGADPAHVAAAAIAAANEAAFRQQPGAEVLGYWQGVRESPEGSPPMSGGEGQGEGSEDVE